MDLTAVGIQHNDGRGPLNLEFVHQGGVRGLDLNRDKVIIHELDDLVVRVRNRTHLLATDSLGIEKVQENRLFRLSGVVLGLGQVVQPANIQGHRDWQRVAVIPILIPFAALSLTELTGSWKGWKNAGLVGAMILLTAWAASPHNEYTVEMMKVDYDSVYNIHYVGPLKKLVDNKEWNQAALLLEDFIDRYEPRALKNIKPSFRCKNSQEAEVFAFFSWIHSIHSQILIPTGDTDAAAVEERVSQRLKEAGDISLYR